jgi:hypothetical protein
MVERQPHPSNRARRLRPATSYVRADSTAEGEQFEVAPAEGKSLAQINLEQMPKPPDADDAEPIDEEKSERPLQFSLRELLVLLTFAAIGLAIVRWLPAGYFAGASGLVAFIALLVGQFWKPKSFVVRALIWAVVTVYFFAALGAAVIQWHKLSAPQPTPSWQAPQRTGQPLP